MQTRPVKEGHTKVRGTLFQGRAGGNDVDDDAKKKTHLGTFDDLLILHIGHGAVGKCS